MSTETTPIRPPGLGLTILEVAARLRCSRSRVFGLLRTGDLDRVDGAPGRETLVTVASVEAYERSLVPSAARRPAPKPKPKPRAPTAADLARRRDEIEARKAALMDRPGAPARRGARTAAGH